MTGFVYRDRDAFAIYHAALYRGHEGHSGPEAYLAIGIGDFSEASSPESRRAVTLRIQPTPDQFRVQVVDAGQSPWSNSVVLGRMMDRSEALADPLITTFCEVADAIVLRDAVIPQFFAAR